MESDHEWHEYYTVFPYFSHSRMRRGGIPLKYIRQGSPRSLVLVHGLTDSPYFMSDLAQFFHEKLGYSVFVPVLKGHGLKEVTHMKGVRSEDWKKNVAYAVSCAAQHGEVAIGGLSTGATLSLWAARNCTEVTGPLFLFSAAIALAEGWWGRLKERCLLSCLVELFDLVSPKRSLVGIHPGRYSRMDLFAARQLVRLMREVRSSYALYLPQNPLPLWLFMARLVDDNIVSIEAIDRLAEKFDSRYVVHYVRHRRKDVSHAGLTLAESIRDAEGNILERGNHAFSHLTCAIKEMHEEFQRAAQQEGGDENHMQLND